MSVYASVLVRKVSGFFYSKSTEHLQTYGLDGNLESSQCNNSRCVKTHQNVLSFPCHVWLQQGWITSATSLLLITSHFFFIISVNELLKIKEDLTKERDDLLQEISRLREQMNDASNLQNKLEQDRADAEEKIQEVRMVLTLYTQL